MDIFRRRNNSPETRRLVEQQNALSRPDTLRRRYDHQTQRTVFAPSRPNKRSGEKFAEIDAELIRANRLGRLSVDNRGAGRVSGRNTGSRRT